MDSLDFNAFSLFYNQSLRCMLIRVTLSVVNKLREEREPNHNAEIVSF